MSEIQVGQINSTDGSTAITTGADGYVSFAKTQIGGRRNLIINGAMQVAQRGTSNVNGTGYSTVDRFELYEGSSPTYTFTSEQVSDAPDGFAKSFKVTADSSATFTGSQNFGLRYKLEGQDVQHFKYGTSSAQSVIISFWVKSSETGDFSLRVMNQSSSGFRQYLTSYTINSANTWEYKTATITGDTVRALEDGNTAEYVISWELDTGADDLSSAFSWTSDGANKAVTSQVNLLASTNNTWQITGVQLEVGTVATPFEHRSYGEELALCQRYYQKFGNTETDGYHRYAVTNCDNSTNARGIFYFPVPMRVFPTLTTSGTFANYSAGTLRQLSSLTLNPTWTETAGNYTHVSLFSVVSSGQTAGNAGMLLSNNSASSLAFDSEL